MDAYEPDECCRIYEAIASGSLEGASEWTCPACGEVWRVQVFGSLRYWRPEPLIAIL